MNALSGLMAKFDSKTLHAWFVFLTVTIALTEAGVQVWSSLGYWIFLSASILGVSYKEGKAKEAAVVKP